MMKGIRFFALVVLLFSAHSASFAQSQASAPLGLSWGMSIAGAKELGIELKEFSGTDFGKSYLAVKLENSIADQSATLLSFGFDDRLWRVVITSRDFDDDPAGSAVLARYNELKNVLSEKYRRPVENHRLGDSIYSQSQYFLAGIRGGNSRWFSNFDTPELFIQLGLTASSNSTGAWRLIYESKPLRKEFDASRRSNEKGKL